MKKAKKLSAVLTALITLVVVSLALTGCMLSDFSSYPVKTSLTLVNSTPYAIEDLSFQYFGAGRRINPMERPAEDDLSLKPGETKELNFTIPNTQFDHWGVSIEIAGIEGGCNSSTTISFKSAGYEITLAEFTDDGRPEFLFTAFEEGETPSANVGAGAFTLTLLLILHTMRDGDLEGYSDIDFGARIMEMFAAIEVVTV